MNWYALKAYIKYKRQAKTRHGVHSPFVFDFVENVLHNKAHIAGKDLQERIGIYYSTNPIYISPDQNDVLHYFEQLMPTLNSDSIIIIKDIHKTPHNTQTWDQLKAHPKVTMSLDLYHIGLLLFKPDFKIKQHFTLK